MNKHQDDTHSALFGYLLWIFGFTGAHRFYFGKRLTGTLWFFTFGLFGIGWFIDLFLIPGMSRDAGRRYARGPVDYDISWLLLTFLGLFGIHRFYRGAWITGILYALTGGLFTVGILWDYWFLNEQINSVHVGSKTAPRAFTAKAPSAPRPFTY